jgi:ribosomal protein S18 acetylase RimI-like enzyme
LTPPSAAIAETPELVRLELEESGGALATLTETGQAVGALRLVEKTSRLQVRRVAVDPACQGRGVGTALMDWAQKEAARRGCAEVWVGVRAQLPRNLEFYKRLGYRVVAEHRHPKTQELVWYEMTRSA